MKRQLATVAIDEATVATDDMTERRCRPMAMEEAIMATGEATVVPGQPIITHGVDGKLLLFKAVDKRRLTHALRDFLVLRDF